MNEDQIKLVAYQTSREAVSDYLDRVLNDHPGYNWERIKSELSSRFAEISDPQHAFTLLHKIKQKHDENIPVLRRDCWRLQARHTQRKAFAPLRFSGN